MMEPMHPTGEDRMTTATNGRATAATGRPPGEEDPGFHTDELIIALQKVPLLRDNLDRIEENFHVIVGLGMCAKEDIEMQWVTIQGLVEDRAQAMSYIKALCSPGKNMEFNFPDELHQTLSHPNVLDRLEKQSNTAILFLSCGHAVIQGEDDLAVALAMSAIEEIIQKYVDVNISDVSSPNSSVGELSDPLDREIRRLSSQNKELYVDDYDMDNLTSLPGPVKRTLLKQYIDDSRQSNGAAQSKCDGAATCPRDSDETIPMRLAGSSSASKIHSQQFVDLHPATVVKPPLLNETWVTVDHPAKSTSLQTDISLSLNLDYDNDNSFVDLSESVSKTAPGTKWENPLVVDTTPTTPAVTDDQPILGGEAITFALKSGYSTEEIDVVCSAYGDILSTAEFIQVLHTNRCEKANERAVTVSELEAKHLPRPAQDRIPEFLVIDDVGTNSSQDEEPVEPECPITPSGKQQSQKTHMQGPKMKKGKLSKRPSKQVGKKTQGRRNRRSPSEENTEKMEVVSLLDGPVTSAANTILPNAVRDMLQDGLHQSMKRKSGREEDDKNNNVLMEYLSLLTQDFNEENSNDIEEVRKRNLVRRKILEKLLELKGSQEPKSTDSKGGKLEETDVAALGGESWNTVSLDGRHRFGKVAGSPVKDNELEAVGGASGGAGTKPKQPDASASNTKPKPHDRSDQSHFHTKEKPAAGGSLDTLDDFSILSNLNDAEDFDPHFPAQPGVRTSNAKTQHKAARPVKSVNPRNPTYVQVQTPQLYKYQPQPVHQAPQPLMSKQIQRPPPPAPVYTSNSGSNPSAKPNLRYIVIDGSNVAMTHGNHEIFSCKGIKLCIDFFRRRGHTEVTAFVPQWRTHAPRPDYPIRDQHLLEELRKDSVLVFTPARRVPGKNIVCYDDKFVLRLAQETEGVIVSNDNYRDLWHEKREWRQIIEERLLMFSFVGDIFMAPDDPLGRDGPHLDEFLRKYSIFPDQYIRDQQQQNRSQHENGLRPYNRHNQGQGSRAAPLQNKFHGRPIQAQGARNTANHFDYNRVYSGARENSQLQDHFLHNVHGQGTGKFPHNPHGQSPGKFLPVAQGQGQRQFGQGAAVGLRQRPLAETESLKQKLSVIFTDQEVKIDEVLQHNPIETNINKIIEFMLEVD